MLLSGGEGSERWSTTRDCREASFHDKGKKIVYISLRLAKRIYDIFELKVAMQDKDIEVFAQISMILHEKIMLAIVPNSRRSLPRVERTERMKYKWKPFCVGGGDASLSLPSAERYLQQSQLRDFLARSNPINKYLWIH